MRGLIEQRQLLAEATYKRDRELRDVAEDFYEKLVRFLKTESHKMITLDDGFFVRASVFWKYPKSNKLLVKFTPRQEIAKGTSMSGGFGHTPGREYAVLVFPSLIGPGNKKSLATRLNKDTVIHEVIHFLDPSSEKSTGGVKKFSATDSSGALDSEKYYNDPSEWNAYWQEGAAKAERLIRNFQKFDPANLKKATRKFFGDGTVSSFRGTVDTIWDRGFLKHMDRKTQRKFDKRLAQLWKKFKNKGLL